MIHPSFPRFTFYKNKDSPPFIRVWGVENNPFFHWGSFIKKKPSFYGRERRGPRTRGGKNPSGERQKLYPPRKKGGPLGPKKKGGPVKKTWGPGAGQKKTNKGPPAKKKNTPSPKGGVEKSTHPFWFAPAGGVFCRKTLPPPPPTDRSSRPPHHLPPPPSV